VGLPVSGMVLIPTTLGISCFSSYLPEWAIFVSVLQGAALVNVSGGFAVGLSPYFFVAALIASQFLPQWLTGRIRFFPEEPAWLHTRVLALFAIWSVISALMLPVLFAGLPVDSPRAGVDRSYYTQAALSLSGSNIGQAGYMILNFALVVCLVQVAIQPGRLKRLVKAFSWSGVFVVAVGAYQILCKRTGLPFPTSFFNSNEVWSQQTDQYIGVGYSFSRLSATFVEPSEAASFLGAWAVFQLSLAITGGRRTGWHWMWATVGSIMLVATASTTGYLTAGIMWVAMAYDCGARILRHGWIRTKAAIAVLALAGSFLIWLFTVPTAWPLLDAVLFSKMQSQSALHRTSTFGRAVGVFQDSWGLGAGLGSNRAMSVFFYILSNLGFPGMLLIGFLLTHLYLQIRLGLRRRNGEATTKAFLVALASAFVANMIALLASGAEVTQPRLWVLWGLLLATIRHGWLMDRYPTIGISPLRQLGGRIPHRPEAFKFA
jgi:hypothetical protein